VTLYKGHLGVGVTEPSGQLELAGDERIQEYPPGPLSDYETLIPGHGVFCVDGSSTYSSYYPWEAFEHVDSDLGWHSLSSIDPFSGTNNAYSGSSALGSYTGAYLKLKLPYKIELKSFSVRNRSDGSTNVTSSPEDFKIIGSNDETNWEELFSISGVVWASTQINKIYSITSNPKTYRYLAFVCTRTVADTSVIIGHIKFFGTPGPTTLDKGSLSLGRSLDVPRISRYDVDTETPRPEKLVVDFDTTVNSTPTDISGEGNHGTFGGNAQYSAPDKAFKFDGEDAGPADYIIGNLNNTGDTDFTVSLWLKKDRSGTAGMLCNFGGSGGSGNPEDSVGLEVGSNNNLNYFIFSGAEGFISNFAVTYLNRWVHIVATRSGNNLNVYLDGVDQNFTTTGSDTLQLAANTEYTIGARGTGSLGTSSLSGYISNFKVYDVVLEPSEVKKLYNLGRTGRSMVISDTAVGIGKAPEAQLDVRGNLNVDGVITTPQRPVFYAYHAANGGATHGAAGATHYTANGHTGIIRFKDTRINVGNCFNTSDYKFYAPISGYYWFEFTGLARYGTGQGNMELSLHKNGVNASQRSFAYTYVLGNPDHDFLAVNVPLFCNAGDTVHPVIHAAAGGVNLYFGEDLGHFSGYLIG
jgi:hypothetical protein